MTKPGDMNRRAFLGRTAAGAAAAALAPGALVLLENALHAAEPSGGAPGWGRRPNILVVMSDEHNAAISGFGGSKLARTPGLDALAGRGVVFEHCYCNAPLCVPSRLSFTAGRYASRLGGWSNDCMLPADTMSLPRLLNAAGYAPYLCGKMHYDYSCRYGFTDLIPKDDTNLNYMRGTGVRRRAGDLASKGVSKRLTGAKGGEAENIAHDRNVTRAAVKFLRERKPGDKPFFLLAGYLCPHFPLVAPEELWAHFQGKVALPNIPKGFLDALPLNYQHLRAGFGLVGVPDAVTRQARELYYALTEWVDGQIARVLAALSQSAAADDTIVIYTSDHGENLGEHGLWWKNAMYDQAAGVPLIVSCPARWAGGQRRGNVCGLVDVVQTIADLGGAAAPRDWNGASLVGLLDKPGAKWQNQAFSEYYGHNVASGFAMLRRDDWKYIYHAAPDAEHGAQRELYDLRNDPQELENLAAAAAQKERRADLHQALLQEVGEDPEKTEARCRADYAKGYARTDKAPADAGKGGD